MPTPDESLMAFVLGEAGPDQRAAIELAASSRPEVAARIAHLQTVLNDLRRAGTLAAEFRVSHTQMLALRRLGPTPSTTASEPVPSITGALEHIARLVFDSWTRPAAAGFRGASAERLLRFEFPGGSVDVRVAVDAESIGKFWITGDAAGLSQGRIVARVADARNPVEAASDEIGPDGSFELMVPSGEYLLEVLSPAGRVQFGPIAVERR